MSQLIHTQDLVGSKLTANEAAQSSPSPENLRFTIREVVERQATIKVKPDRSTRERWSLNFEKVLNACRAALKSVNGQDKKSRLDDATDAMLQEELTVFISEKLKTINALNSMSLTKKVVPDFRADVMFEKLTAVGRNELKLREQKLFIGIAIREANERLTALQRKPTPNLEAEEKAKERIAKLEKMQVWILSQIETQESAGVK